MVEDSGFEIRTSRGSFYSKYVVLSWVVIELTFEIVWREGRCWLKRKDKIKERKRKDKRNESY